MAIFHGGSYKNRGKNDKLELLSTSQHHSHDGSLNFYGVVLTAVLNCCENVSHDSSMPVLKYNFLVVVRNCKPTQDHLSTLRRTQKVVLGLG